jgi:ABC-type branched-subunit amino acid transport system substrate-binding protein
MSSKEASSSGGWNFRSWCGSLIFLARARRSDTGGPPCPPRSILPFVLMLALSGVLVFPSQGASGSPSGVVRIGYIAPAAGQTPPASGDPGPAGRRSPEEVADYLGLLGARQGASEMDYTARLMGRRVELVEAPARGPDEAAAQATRLAGRHVAALLGGFDAETAAALSRVARERRLLFFNVGATDDRLRNADCDRFMFHVEASDAMYLDAAADWYIRGLAFLIDENAPQGIKVIRRNPARTWFLVTEDAPAYRARRDRLRAALELRHWGGRVIADAVVRAEADLAEILPAIRRTRPDLVFLLLPAAQQLLFYREFSAARLPDELTGFPEPGAQTRTFFGALLRDAPAAARGSIRIVAWEPTFAAVGGPQLAQRFFKRWKRPMDGPAWTSWVAVKIVWDAITGAQTSVTDGVLRYLEAPGTVFEGYQGIGMTFRPWDHQLRHPVMASRLKAASGDLTTLAEMYGQFPNVLAPGREPNQVLDQLGDTASTSQCRWR